MEEIEDHNAPSEEESAQPFEAVEIGKRKFTPLKKKNDKMTKKLRLQYENMYRNEILGSRYQANKNEQELEQLVFGGEDDVLEQLEKNVKQMKKDDIDDGIHDEDVPLIENDKEEETPRLPAWEDDDDEKILVNDKLQSMKNIHNSLLKRADQKYETLAREKFLKITGEPSWAALKKKKSTKDGCDGSDDEGDLMRKTGNFILKSQSLPKGKIDIRKCQNLTEANSRIDTVKCVEFHPLSRVAVVAGKSDLATLFQIDGKINPKIQTVCFERFPISTAHFSMDGNELIVSSRECSYYFSYDMIEGKISKIPWEFEMENFAATMNKFYVSPDGKLMIIHGRYGKIHVISAKSKEWIQTLKMNGDVIASTFNADGSKLFTHGDHGQVYVWDMNSRLCIHKFVDEGCITGTSLASSYNGQYLATGSDSGIVNVYDASSVMTASEPKPLKVVMNLTTNIHHLKFNRSSELLAMSSPLKSAAVKLMHFPSRTVFSNFPVEEKNIRCVTSLDISPNSGYMLFGNNAGKALLYRLRHYQNY